MSLNATRLGLAGGILWGVCLFAGTLLAVHTGYAAEPMKLLENVFPGYQVSNEGSIIGLIYGFLDGFIKLFLLGWLYNLLGNCGCCKDSTCCKTNDSRLDTKYDSKYDNKNDLNKKL